MFLVDDSLLIEVVNESMENLQLLHFEVQFWISDCPLSDLIIPTFNLTQIFSRYINCYLTVLLLSFSPFLPRSGFRIKFSVINASFFKIRSQIPALSASEYSLPNSISFRMCAGTCDKGWLWKWDAISMCSSLTFSFSRKGLTD